MRFNETALKFSPFNVCDNGSGVTSLLVEFLLDDGYDLLDSSKWELINSSKIVSVMTYLPLNLFLLAEQILSITDIPLIVLNRDLELSGTQLYHDEVIPYISIV